MKVNNLDLDNWKDLDINTDSLWFIKSRDRTGKHKNTLHGNFIPQIPNQLIRRYTRENETLFEPFMGSGTTLFECEKLNRKYIGIDINSEMVDYVNEQMKDSSADFKIAHCNALDTHNLYNVLNNKLVQFVLMHPPYMDIIKFTNHKDDLSQISDLSRFVNSFKVICENTLKALEKNRYFALVIGDIYRNSEVIPLSFYCMDMIKRSFKVKLKGVVVKNIEGNRGKLGTGGIWRYRVIKEKTLC